MTIQYKRLQASDYQLLYQVDVPEISINRLVFDLDIEAFMPVAVLDLCACVIRVETRFGYGSIICYFAPTWLPLTFSDFFRAPHFGLRLRTYSFHP